MSATAPRARQVQHPKRAREEFLEQLRDGATVVDAANASSADRGTLYRWRKEDEEFAAAWEEAYEQGTDALEKEAERRAVDGSDTLMIFMLKGRRPGKFRDNTRVEVNGQMNHTGTVTVQHERRLTLADVAAFATTLDGPGPGDRGQLPAPPAVLAEPQPD